MSPSELVDVVLKEVTKNNVIEYGLIDHVAEEFTFLRSANDITVWQTCKQNLVGEEFNGGTPDRWENEFGIKMEHYFERRPCFAYDAGKQLPDLFLPRIARGKLQYSLGKKEVENRELLAVSVVRGKFDDVSHEGIFIVPRKPLLELLEKAEEAFVNRLEGMYQIGFSSPLFSLWMPGDISDHNAFKFVFTPAKISNRVMLKGSSRHYGQGVQGILRASAYDAEVTGRLRASLEKNMSSINEFISYYQKKYVS